VTKPNPENCKNCSSKYADCAQLQYTIQNNTDHGAVNKADIIVVVLRYFRPHSLNGILLRLFLFLLFLYILLLQPAYKLTVDQGLKCWKWVQLPSCCHDPQFTFGTAPWGLVETLPVRLLPKMTNKRHLCHPRHFYAGCPSWHDPPNLSWLGSGTKYAGLHTHSSISSIKQETQLKLAVADRTKPEVEIWRRPKKSTF